MPAVVVPPRAGVLSAVGMLAAPRQVDLVRSWPDPADHAGAEAAAAALGWSRGRAGAGGAMVEVALDCRYAGQSHELTVPAVDAFAAEHARRNGFAMGGRPVEVVALRASARWPSPVDIRRPARRRTGTGPVAGPAVIAEADCTIWVAPGWRADVHPSRFVAADQSRLTMDPAALQVLISQLTGVATEMGEVLRRSVSFPEHQGAGRLLGRRVHRRRRAAGPGRAHPGAPRQHARVGRAPPSAPGSTSGPATRSSSTTPSPAAPTSTT